MNPLPEENSMAEFGKFCTAEERPGKQLEFPIKMTHEAGFSFDVSDTAFALEPAIDAVWKTAVIDGSNIMGVANIAYPQMARSGNGASKSGPGGGAFWKVVDAKVESLMVAAELQREMQMIYGPGSASTALCDIGVNGAAVLSGANLNAGQTIRLTTASWIAGFWPQMINSRVDIYSSDGATLVETDVTVTSIDPTKCQVVLTKSGSTNGLSNGDKLYVKMSHHRSCIGIQPILENSGTIFTISASTYPVWRAVSFPVSGALSRSKIGQFASRLFANGHKGGGKLFTGGAAFQDCVEEASGLQRYTENTDKIKKQGADNIVYVTAVGEINLTLHRYIKQGIALFIAKNVLKRVGSTDLTFDLDGSNKWFYNELPYNAGCQIRIFSNQAPILESPWHCGILTGIASAADVASAA